MLVIGLIIPFIGTSLGSAIVFFMNNTINKKIEKLLLGFTSGVMIAASMWSLLLPAIDMSENYRYKFIPASAGFMLGMLFFIAIDYILLKLHINDSSIDINKPNLKKSMVMLAVTLHNIPEGMAVGVTFAAALSDNSYSMMLSALTLSLGIAIQNFPEGAIISLPLKSEGRSKINAFTLGVLSGIVEPIFGFLTILLTSIIKALLPYLLGFAAGAMIYVVVHELIPDSVDSDSKNLSTIGLAVGFITMMILDVALG